MKKDPIAEARRYVENARKTLSENGQLNLEAHRYEDPKEDGYNIMHLYMTYDGVQSKNTCDDGFRLANDIIDRCATMLV